MTGENDFFITFDSNIEAFSAATKKELDGLNRYVTNLNKKLSRLGDIKLPENVKALPAGRDAIFEEYLKNAPGVSASGGGGKHGELDFASVQRDFQSAAAEMSKIVDQVKLTVVGVKALTEQLAEAGKVQANRVRGAKVSASYDEGERLDYRRARLPSGGTIDNKRPGTKVSAADLAAHPERIASGAYYAIGSEVHKAIQQGIDASTAVKAGASTTGQTDPATLKIVTALNKVETAVKDSGSKITQDLEKLVAAAPRVVTSSETVAAAKDVASGGAKKSKAKKEKAEAEAATAAEQTATESKKEAKAKKKNARIVEQMTGRQLEIQQSLELSELLSKMDVEQRRQFIKDNKVGKKQLLQIGQDVQSQGYGDFSKGAKLRIPDLLDMLSNAGAEYVRQGRVPAKPAGPDDQTKISKSMKQELAPLINVLTARSEEYANAVAVRSTDRRSGGSGRQRALTAAVDVAGGADAAKIQEEIAASVDATLKQLADEAKEIEENIKLLREIEQVEKGINKETLADKDAEYKKRRDVAQQIKAQEEKLAEVQRKALARAHDIKDEGSIQVLGAGKIRASGGQRAEGKRTYGVQGEQVVLEAEKIFDEMDKRARDLALSLAKTPGYTPYGRGAEIEGSGPQATAAKQSLGLVKKAFLSIDDLAEEMYKGATISDKKLAALFSSPEFQSGFVARRGGKFTKGGEYRPALDDLSPAEAFRTRTPPDSILNRRFIREGLLSALAGGQTAPGSRFDTVRKLPGTRIADGRIGFEKDVDTKVLQRVNAAFERMVGAFRQLTETTQGTAEEAEALKNAEQATNRFLNRVAKVTGQDVLGVSQITGRDLTDPYVIEQDRRRQDFQTRRRLRDTPYPEKDPVIALGTEGSKALRSAEERRVKSIDELTKAEKAYRKAADKRQAAEAKARAALDDEAKGALAALDDRKAALREQRAQALAQRKAAAEQVGQMRGAKVTYGFERIADDQGRPLPRTDINGPGGGRPRAGHGFPSGITEAAHTAEEIAAAEAKVAAYDEELAALKAEQVALEQGYTKLIGRRGAAARKAESEAIHAEAAARAERNTAVENAASARSRLLAPFEQSLQSRFDTLEKARQKYQHDPEGSVGFEQIKLAEEKYKEASDRVSRFSKMGPEELADEVAKWAQNLQEKYDKAVARVDKLRARGQYGGDAAFYEEKGLGRAKKLDTDENPLLTSKAAADALQAADKKKQKEKEVVAAEKAAVAEGYKTRVQLLNEEQATRRKGYQAEARKLRAQKKEFSEAYSAIIEEVPVQKGGPSRTARLSDEQKKRRADLRKKMDAAQKKIDELDAQARGVLDEVGPPGVGGTGGGRRGGGRGGAGGAGGLGGGDALSLLRQIRDAINRMHTTIKGGVPTRGTTSGGTGGGTAKPTGSTTRTGGANRMTPEQRAAQEQSLNEARRLTVAKRTQKNLADAARLAELQAQNEAREAEASRQATEQAIQQAVADQKLAAAKELVSQATLQELEQLEKLEKAGAGAEEIAAQRIKTLQAIRRDVGGHGYGEAAKASTGRTLLGGSSGISSADYKGIDEAARAFENAQGQMASALGDQSPLRQALNSVFGTHGFWARIVASTGTFVVRNFAAGFVFGITNALQEVVKQAIVTEQTFVRVSNALEATGKSVGSLRADLQRISTDYGTSLNDVYDVAAGLVGLFKSPIQIASATRVVAQLNTISDGALNAQEAMGVLGSITSAYSDQLNSNVEGFSHVADVLTTIQNVIGTNVEVTAEGVASLSGLAKQLHLGFEQTAVLTAQIAKQTNQTGAAAGEQFGRILGSLQTGRGQGAITKAFTESANAGKISKDQADAIQSAFQSADYGSVLNVLMKNWDSLSESQQKNIAVTVAGQRQMRAFAALMGNTKATLEDIDKATYTSGSAQDRMNKIMHQLNGQLKILGANFQNLANNLVRTGILDAVAVSLRLINTALGGVNDVLTRLNDLADSNGALKLLKNITFGVLGLVAALKLLDAAKRGIGTAVRGRIGATTATEIAGGGTGTAGAANAGILSQLLFGIGRGRNPAASEIEKITLAQRLRNASAAAGGFSDRYALRRSNLGIVAGETGVNSRAATRFGRAIDSGIYATRLAATEKAAAGASKALGGGAAALEAIAAGGLAVQGPLAVAGVGLLALADNISRTNKAARDAAKTLDELNNRLGVTTTKGEKDKNKTELQKFGDKAGATWRLTGDVAGETMRDLLHPSQWKGLVTGGVPGIFSRGIARDRGTVTGTNMGYGVAEAQAMFNNERKILDNVKGGPDALLAEQQRFNGDLIKAKEKITNDSSLSTKQKDMAYNALLQVQKAIQDQTSTLILKAKGIKRADAMTTEQVQSLMTGIQTIQSLGGAGSAGGVDLTPLYDSLKSDIGANDKGQIKGLLADMTSGMSDDLHRGLDVRKAMQIALDNVNAMLSTMPKEDERYATLQQLAQQLGQELIASTKNIMDALKQNADTAASVFAARGNYGAAAGAYRPGIRQARQDLAEAKGPPAALQSPFQKMMNPRTPDDKKKIIEDQAIIDQWTQTVTQYLLQKKLKKLQAELAVADPEAAKEIQREINAITAKFLGQRAKDVPGSVTQDQLNQANQANTQSQEDHRQKILAQKQAAIQTQAAAAGPGNAMAIARAQLAQARLAQQDAIRFGKASVEYQTATQQVIAAQYAIVSAEGDIAQANANLRAAYANARGDSVGAAKAGLAAANAALAYARRLSGGARSAEVINAQAQVVQARAAVQEARLQDQQDTIDFNLQMGKITAAGAIQALQNILRTEKLNKIQRRALLLKIKSMKDELSQDGQWNFGDIHLPTPYSVRRYLAQQKLDAQKRAAAAAGIDNNYDIGLFGRGGATRFATSNQTSNTTNHRTEILINGADTGKIIQLIKQIVGGNVTVRTVQQRRR